MQKQETSYHYLGLITGYIVSITSFDSRLRIVPVCRVSFQLVILQREMLPRRGKDLQMPKLTITISSEVAVGASSPKLLVSGWVNSGVAVDSPGPVIFALLDSAIL